MGRLDRLSPQAVFLLIVGIFGTALAIITPPVQVPDEPNHLLRIYQLSEGTLLATNYGGVVPDSLAEIGLKPALWPRIAGRPGAKTTPSRILRSFDIPLEPEKAQWRHFPNSSLYSPVPYAPQTLAVLIARKLHSPAMGLLFAGRLGSVIGYLLVGWGAIRVTPILKWPACMVMTNPMALFLAGSVSADPFTLALVFLGTGLLLRCVLSPVELSAGTLVAVFVTMLAVALSKFAYVPIVLLVLAVPRRNWGAGHRRWLIPLAIILISGLVVAGWSTVTDAGHVKEIADLPVNQMHWIETHPVEYVGVIWRTIGAFWNQVTESAIGTLGWMDTGLAPAVISFSYIAFIWIVLAYDEPVRLGVWPRVVAAVASLACGILIITANYLVWNRIGGPYIEGLQGRYFLPCAIVFWMIFHRRGSYVARPGWMLVMLGGIAAYTVWIVVERYYLHTPGFVMVPG